MKRLHLTVMVLALSALCYVDPGFESAGAAVTDGAEGINAAQETAAAGDESAEDGSEVSDGDENALEGEETQNSESRPADGDTD